MKISEHFDIREFIDPETYKQEGNNSILKIDQKLIVIAELLRKLAGRPVTINNWHTGGQYKESGLRSPNTTTGAKKSAHKEGKAIDCKVSGMKASEVWELILNNECEFYCAGVRQMEDISFTPTWIHLATRGADNPQHKIQIIKP